MFEDIEHVCCQGAGENGCACNHYEMVIRRYSVGDIQRPMTDVERRYVIEDADRCAEGALTQEELEAMSDQQLANATLHAWLEYARSNCGF